MTRFVVPREWSLLATALSISLLLLGCGAAGDASGAQEYVYTLTLQSGSNVNFFDFRLAAFGVDAAGHLHPVPGQPYTVAAHQSISCNSCPAASPQLQSDPLSRFLLLGGAVPCTAEGCPIAVIGPDHRPTFRVAQAPAASGTILDPLGRFVFTPSGFSTSIGVNAIAADLSFPEVPGSPFSPGPAVSPFSRNSAAAVDPTGKFLIVAVQGSTPGRVLVYRVADSGVLTVASSVATPVGGGGSVLGIFTHPSGKFVYLEYEDAVARVQKVAAYALDSAGKLTATGFVGDLQPGIVLGKVHPSGNFFLAVQCSIPGCSFGSNAQVLTLPIDPTTGAVDLTPSFSLPETPGLWSTLALDPTGQFLFATTQVTSATGQFGGCSQASQLLVYNVDAATGRLTPVTSADIPGCGHASVFTH